MAVSDKYCCCHVQATKLTWVEKPELSDLGKLVFLSHGQWWCSITLCLRRNPSPLYSVFLSAGRLERPKSSCFSDRASAFPCFDHPQGRVFHVAYFVHSQCCPALLRSHPNDQNHLSVLLWPMSLESDSVTCAIRYGK